MVDLYPLPGPYARGMLEVGDGNQIHWEEAGNPEGTPALLVHGGPGAGFPPNVYRRFDPSRYRVILFDQRGCGRSTPNASDPATDMSVNTTEHLLADMERLREARGVERCVIYGASWGTTLALAYAQRHPERVLAMVLEAITTARHREIDWLYEGAGRIFPREWARFRAHVPGDEPLLPAYARLMEDPSAQVRATAAVEWNRWENTVLSLEPNSGLAFGEQATPEDVAFVRICARYYSNYAWLEDGVLLREAGRLAGIAGVLIHGKLDLSCPSETAVALADAWSDAELVLLDDAGHKGTPSKREALVRATDRFADLSG